MNGSTSTAASASTEAERPPDADGRSCQSELPQARLGRGPDLKRAEAVVSRLRNRIAKAEQQKKRNTVNRLKYLLSHSYYAKLLAARNASAVKTLAAALYETILGRGKAWDQEYLIKKLNRQMRDRIKKHYMLGDKIFARIDFILHELLWRWAKRRHPGKGHRWISAKYWRRKGGRGKVFSTESGSELLRPRKIFLTVRRLKE